MPEGLVNILSGRQEFLGLTRYLLEIAALFIHVGWLRFPTSFAASDCGQRWDALINGVRGDYS